MLGNIRDRVKTRWDQFRVSISEILPTLNTAEIRKLSWAKRLKSYEEVPDIYKPFFQPLLREGRAFPHTILTPTFEGLLQAQTTEKLVCDLDCEIYVLERVADTVKVYDFLLEGISCIEVRIVLLDSHIKLSGITKDGAPASVTIKFNTATEELFAPMLEKIRRAAIGAGDSDLGCEMEKLDYLEKLNYKFMNYARHSLLSGETILQILWQPKIQERVLTILGKAFYRTISRAHLSLLTDRELILIREEENPRVIGEYGKVWTYIPLKKTVNLALDGEGRQYPMLSVQLPEGTRIGNLYQASATPEIRQLLSRFASITANH